MLTSIVVCCAVVVGAYLLGSIPTAVWIGKRFYGIDVREHGSGNAGATNTLRTLGNKAGFTVLGIDILKGFLAVMLIHLVPESHIVNGNRDLLKIMLAIAAVTGHTYPLFAGFKGGKGVATTGGAAFGLFPLPIFIILLIFIAIVAITRYISVGSIVGSILLPFVYYFVNTTSICGPPSGISIPLFVLTILIAVFIPITHAKNIKRLMNGTESKLSLRKK